MFAGQEERVAIQPDGHEHALHDVVVWLLASWYCPDGHAGHAFWPTVRSHSWKYVPAGHEAGVQAWHDVWKPVVEVNCRAGHVAHWLACDDVQRDDMYCPACVCVCVCVCVCG